MPQNVRSLEYRTTSPTEIFSASETLAKLSGLESFICTDIQITFEARSRFTVKQVKDKQLTWTQQKCYFFISNHYFFTVPRIRAYSPAMEFTYKAKNGRDKSIQRL